MASVAARNCLLAVLLTAAVARGDRTLADTPSSAPAAALATLRCEPGPDFSTPTRVLRDAQEAAPFGDVAADRAATHPAIVAAPGLLRAPARSALLPARTWSFSRGTTRTSVYLGVNRRGVAGVHFFQHAPAATSIPELAPQPGGE